MSDAPLVRQEHDRGIARLVLDSPHNRNALSARLVGELGEALSSAGRDPGVRAVLLTHTGTTFCAGADLTERVPTGPAALTGLLRAVAALDKPVVGLTLGHVRAGGVGLLAACDIAVAGPAATFAFTEARLGLAPAVISLTVLRRMHAGHAARYFLTGEVLDARAAAAAGLVAAGEEELDGVLDGLRAASPQGLAESKRLTAAPVLAAIDAGGAGMAELSARLFASPDAAEGVRAFRERRKPSWAAR